MQKKSSFSVYLLHDPTPTGNPIFFPLNNIGQRPPTGPGREEQNNNLFLREKKKERKTGINYDIVAGGKAKKLRRENIRRINDPLIGKKNEFKERHRERQRETERDRERETERETEREKQRET